MVEQIDSELHGEALGKALHCKDPYGTCSLGNNLVQHFTVDTVDVDDFELHGEATILSQLFSCERVKPHQHH